MEPVSQVSKSPPRPTQQFKDLMRGSTTTALEEVEINHHRCVRGNWCIQKIDARELQGLRSITRLVVDSAPELDDVVLESALECAPNLKHLELKNIGGLSYPGMTCTPFPPLHRRETHAGYRFTDYHELSMLCM